MQFEVTVKLRVNVAAEAIQAEQLGRGDKFTYAEMLRETVELALDNDPEVELGEFIEFVATAS